MPTLTQNQTVPLEILAVYAFVDFLSITQLETTARTLPGMFHAAAQPILHSGTKIPIGAVLVFQGWIHPPSHWRGDIDAGWLDSRLDCPDPRWKEIRAGRLLRNYEVLREGARRTQKAREIRLENDKETAGCSAGEEWDAALGTIGAGNHFAELQVVEESTMSRSAFGTEASQHDFVRA